MQDLVFDNFANKHSVIGSMKDLNAATIQDVQQFFRIYYAPNNAVLTLVGDFQPAEALAKIKKYFGDIPAQPAPPVPDLAEPKQTAERRKTIEDPFARFRGWTSSSRFLPATRPTTTRWTFFPPLWAKGSHRRSIKAW